MSDDMGLMQIIAEKIENEDFAIDDLEDYFRVFCFIGNSNEEFQEEIEGWNKKILFDLHESGHFWISIEAGKLSSGKGEIESSNLVLKIKPENVLKIFSDELDPGVAFMTGKLKLKGDLPDALKFAELMELVAEELEID